MRLKVDVEFHTKSNTNESYGKKKSMFCNSINQTVHVEKSRRFKSYRFLSEIIFILIKESPRDVAATGHANFFRLLCFTGKIGLQL